MDGNAGFVQGVLQPAASCRVTVDGLDAGGFSLA